MEVAKQKEWSKDEVRMAMRIASELVRKHKGRIFKEKHALRQEGYLYLRQLYGKESALWTIKTFYYIARYKHGYVTTTNN